jgi:hypothetical protein
LLAFVFEVVFEVSVVVADDADERVDGSADPYHVAEDFEDGAGAKTVVQPRTALKPDADVGRELEPEGAGRDDGPT